MKHRDILTKISTWNKVDGYLALLDLVEHYLSEDLDISVSGDLYTFSFGNTKKCRDVLQSLRKNNSFWQECWFSSNRNYVFCFEVLM